MIRHTLSVFALAAGAFAGCATSSTSRSGGSDTSAVAATSSTEVIPLQYVDATSTAEQLQSQHAGAQIVAESHMNAIVVIGTPSEVDAIRQAVSRVDQPG